MQDVGHRKTTSASEVSLDAKKLMRLIGTDSTTDLRSTLTGGLQPRSFFFMTCLPSEINWSKRCSFNWSASTVEIGTAFGNSVAVVHLALFHSCPQPIAKQSCVCWAVSTRYSLPALLTKGHEVAT